jgi:hypothetical protein
MRMTDGRTNHNDSRQPATAQLDWTRQQMKEFFMEIDAASFDLFIKLGQSLGELEVTMGPAARPVIAEIRARLAEASVLQKNGDTPAAIASIRGGMERLAALAAVLDPAEAMQMRMLSEHFSNALRIGDKHATKSAVNIMRHKAGDPKDEPNSDW